MRVRGLEAGAHSRARRGAFVAWGKSLAVWALCPGGAVGFAAYGVGAETAGGWGVQEL